jgi:hypothetical protein
MKSIGSLGEHNFDKQRKNTQASNNKTGKTEQPKSESNAMQNILHDKNNSRKKFRYRNCLLGVVDVLK